MTFVLLLVLLGILPPAMHVALVATSNSARNRVRALHPAAEGEMFFPPAAFVVNPFARLFFGYFRYEGLFGELPSPLQGDPALRRARIVARWISGAKALCLVALPLAMFAAIWA